MAKKTEPSKYAAALQYLQQMRDRAADFGGGVVDTLGNRARDVGGLAYEALTSDPSIGRMTTAEFSQAAADRPSTPRLDATAQGIGAMGKALVTQPVQTAKAIVVDPIVNAFESPRAMGQFAGDFVNPLRIAAALRKTAPIAELDVYHGTPHQFPGTEENPLGEFDASKIGTGEGAQVFGHGIYYAENPDVARIYSADRAYVGAAMQGKPQTINFDSPEWTAQQTIDEFGDSKKALAHLQMVQRTASKYQSPETKAGLQGAIDLITSGGVKPKGSLYKADLPDDMIDRMLDYDKPINEQSQVVLNALERAGINTESTALAGSMAQGQERHLAKYGIPGIKYLDEGSRGKSGSGTRNFVVFPGEEKKVRILERK